MAYDYESYAINTAEGIFVYKTAVCDGYAGFTDGLLKRFRHAWNAVMLDDEWFRCENEYFNITDVYG